ncbi:4Fe-4S binding protein [Parabacteroides sp. OttesenSCG-928-N08]|nr:4Fe-4S binding protein [Parabacteroides sp. OttesenSCG-928-N08]
MKKPNYLKGLRVGIAILIFLPILFYFLDFRNDLPNGLHRLLHLQLIPALLAGMAAIVIIQLLLAFLFGRVYCSMICPAGILQDIINRIYCIGKKKNKGSRRFGYKKPQNLLRYSLTALTFLLIPFGILLPGLLLDPYSNFGRIATNLFRPAAVFINNLLAELFAMFDNYTLFHVKLTTITTPALIGALIALGVFVGLTIWRGRLFCNTLCPVGGLLSLVSRFSLFRIDIDQSKCSSCGLCEKSCKAEAIDTKTMRVDASRCVSCFNCVSKCKKDSLHYRYAPVWKKEKKEETVEPISNSRRTFLATGATVAASLPVVSAIAAPRERKRLHQKPLPITPPGSLSIERFKDKCTGCHLCVVQCPSQLLRPAGLEYGFDYMLKPHMSYLDSYCNYECVVCSEVCPNHAILPITVEEKVTTQVGIAHFILNRCIVETDNTDCGACSEHCPVQAVHMELYKEGSTLTVPVVEPELCIGCGGCESICPVRPHRAIIIKANPVHQRVEKPAEEKALEIEIDGFGF